MSFYPIPDGHQGNCGVAIIALDVTDRKRSEEKIKKITEELTRSNRALEDFSSIASHDLKEPIRTISSFVTLLERKFNGQLDSDTQECIQYIVGSTERMKRLIDKILEYSIAGRVRGEFSGIDSNKILKTVLKNLKESLEKSQCSITSDQLPKVWGDEYLLIQVFQNLITNAIKYRSATPLKIRIAVKRETNAWVISVSDNGIGIRSDDFASIFTPFKKLHSQHEYPGSGLGLAICHKNIERLGGRIWVQSQEGVGSTFYFTLPILPLQESVKGE